MCGFADVRQLAVGPRKAENGPKGDDELYNEQGVVISLDPPEADYEKDDTERTNEDRHDNGRPFPKALYVRSFIQHLEPPNVWNLCSLHYTALATTYYSLHTKYWILYTDNKHGNKNYKKPNNKFRASGNR